MAFGGMFHSVLWLVQHLGGAILYYVSPFLSGSNSCLSRIEATSEDIQGMIDTRFS